MHLCAGHLILFVLLSLTGAAGGDATIDVPKKALGASESARIVIRQDELEPIEMKVNGDRMKQDGRLRFVGSVGRGEESERVRWDFAVDPNPYGGASIEGSFEVEGPFLGTLTFHVPFDPVIDGRVALKSATTLRVASDEPGVLLQLRPNETLSAILVDHQPVIRHGRGPLSIERHDAGVSAPRTWSVGEAEGEEPIFVDGLRKTLSVRVRCVLEEGRRAVYFSRVQLVGDPDDFRFRSETGPLAEESLIPRRNGSISITVPGAASSGVRGRGAGRVNKPPAVIRPSKTERDD